MSDKWVHIQRDEIKSRNRDQRLATQREAQRLAEQRNRKDGR